MATKMNMAVKIVKAFELELQTRIKPSNEQQKHAHRAVDRTIEESTITTKILWRLCY